MRKRIGAHAGLLLAISFVAVMAVACVLAGIPGRDEGGSTVGGRFGPLEGSNLYQTDVGLNASIGYLNFTATLEKESLYDVQLAVPSGFDFDLFLYHPPSNQVGSSAARDTGGLNETITYMNTGLKDNYTVQVRYFNGTGTGLFNLSVVLVPDTTGPVLSASGVSPNDTIIFNTYTFVTTYSDADGYPAEYVNLLLDGIAYPMTRNASTGTNYVAGVQYFRQFLKLEAGVHPFSFNASDWSQGASTSSFNVKVNKPYSFAVNGTSSYLSQFGAGYNTTWLWSSTSNRDPWQIVTNQYLSPNSSIRIQGDTYPQKTIGTLTSPLFDLTTAGTSMLQLVFGYRYLWTPVSLDPAELDDIATVEVQVNMSGIWDDVDTCYPVFPEAWQRAQVNITSYKRSYVQFRFRFTGVITQHLYIDDFAVKVFSTGTASFYGPMILSPTNVGDAYTVFTAKIRYRETAGNLPEDVILYVCEGLTYPLYVRSYDFLPTNPNDWNVTDADGKEYYCQFQLYDVTHPRLYAWATGISRLTPLVYSLNTPTIESLETAAFPYILDFEAGSPMYYVIDDPSYGSPIVATGGGNAYFTTGQTTGNFSDTSDAQLIGLATPYLALSESPVNLFLEFNSTIVGLGIFRVNITSNYGATWTTISELDAGSGDFQSIDISAYKGETVSVRFVVETAIMVSFPIGRWDLDNIRIHEVDLTPPTMSNPSISENQWLFGVVNVDMTVDDVGFGVDHVTVHVDGAHLATISSFPGKKAQFSLDTTRFANGDHEVTIVVVDRSGNQNSYAIVVHVDNTPYWLYATIAAAAVVFGIYGYRKFKAARPAIQRKLRGEAIPPAGVAKKILEVTSVFRRTSARDLSRKLEIKGLTPEATLAYLRYMLNEGMIKGDLDGDVFTRVIAGKMKAIVAEKEGAIVGYLRGRKQASVPEMIKDLQLEAVRKEAIEDFIMGLVVSRKINCYFEGDTIFIEDEAAAKVTEALPEPEPTPAPKPAPRAARMKAPAEETGEGTEATAAAVVPAKKGPPAALQARGAAPAKAPWTVADKKGDIVRLLSSKEHVTFEDIRKEFGLRETTEEIEDYLFGLIKSREIKGIIEDDGFSRRD
ncbi:MAG: hypothetical protein JW839_07375 [Candidatus Lokiarchaeota archaeon]|nr:hypothetical protein [Candidatus Lokiarchaeota archaeon]